MIRARNYEAMSKFVKAMPRILWPLFSGVAIVLMPALLDSECLGARI